MKARTSVCVSFVLHEPARDLAYMLTKLDLTKLKSVVWVEASLNLLPAYCLLVIKLSILYTFPNLILKTFEKDIDLDANSTLQVEKVIWSKSHN